MRYFILCLIPCLHLALTACYHIPRDDFNYPLRPQDITEIKPDSGLQNATKDLRRSAKFAKLSTQVIFEHASYELNTANKKVLDEIAQEMIQTSGSYERIRIAGFTDPSGSSSRNLRLSQLRADHVRKYLIEKGVPSQKLEAIGMGATSYEQDFGSKPQATSERRVDFEIVQ